MIEAEPIAIAISAAPWIPERKVTLDALLGDLTEQGDVENPFVLRVFDDRGDTSRVWASKEWEWARKWARPIVGANVFLALQDDCIIPTFFIRSLQAMLTALPPRAILGLASVHPYAHEVKRLGERWFRTRAWVMGWGYAMRRAELLEFEAFEKEHEGSDHCEDALVAAFATATKRDVWHPVPTIVQHNTLLASTWAQSDLQKNRSQVTWEHGYSESDLTNPEFWKQDSDPILAPRITTTACILCYQNLGMFTGTSGFSICAPCLGKGTESLMKRMGVPVVSKENAEGLLSRQQK